jgi:hypothetical protein
MNRGLEKNASCGASWFVLHTDYDLADQVKDDEMGRACGTYNDKKKFI